MRVNGRLRAAMRDWGSVSVWLSGAGLAAFVAYYFSGVDTGRLTAVTDFAYLPISVVALATTTRVALARRLDRRTRLAWGFVALAAFCKLWANGAWFWLEAVRGSSPYPSVADIGYLAFIPCLLTGLLLLPSHRRTRREQAKLALDVLTVIAGGFMVLWYLVLGPTVAAGGTGTLVTLVSLAYPVGDLVLLFGVVAVLFRGTTRASRRPLQIMVGTAALFIVADVYYGYLGLHADFVGGSWPDLCFLTATWLLAVSGHSQHWWSTQADRTVGAAQGLRPVSRLPYAAIAGGYALLLGVARGQRLYPLGGLVAGAVVLTGAVVLRQLSVLHENRELAVTDGLTGIANRSLLRASLARALARFGSAEVAVLLIDLDKFKQINDSLGHEAGDAVLVATAERLRACARPSDTPGRLGGDEFALVLQGVRGLPGAVANAELLLRALCAPVPFGGRELAVGASIGVAVSEPGVTPSELLHRADVAMYAAKKGGGGGCLTWRPDLDPDAGVLRAAAAAGQLSLWS